MVSPHFPPDTSAGSHRVRLLAPHLSSYGWEPTVVSVNPSDYEGRLDTGLSALVPPTLRVERAPAWRVRWTRRAGFGDLGLRALSGLHATCSRLLATEAFDALFITVYPTYPALLGPVLKRRHRVPFVLDYQDPWVGAWGETVGSGSGGTPDLRSRLSRRLGTMLEPVAVRAADAITAVSTGTYEAILDRYTDQRGKRCAPIPLGGEPADYDFLQRNPRANPYFSPADGCYHLCYVGTLLPLGFETLRAVLSAARRLREREPALFERLRLHFFGTSNQTTTNTVPRVLPVARELGVADCVTEVPQRIDYLDALTVQTQASAILMMGSSERHYTASKLYPGLLARRPILAAYHEASTVTEILRQVAGPPAVHLVTYGDEGRAESKVEELCDALAAMTRAGRLDAPPVSMTALDKYSAHALAGRLAAVFDAVTGK